MPKKIPAEQTINVPVELRGVSAKNVLTAAARAWPVLMTEIRKSAVRETAEKYWGSFPLPLKGEAGRNIELTYLSTTGCQHATGGEKGCTFCDYGSREKVTQKELADAAVEALDMLEASNEGQEKAVFNITPSGSFFDEKELSPKIQEYVLRRIRGYKDRHPELKGLMFATETRLEFVTEEKIANMRKELGEDIEIEIGYGMESTDELIREGIINKKLPEDYRERIAIMKKYKMEVAGHVITKPTFLTEKEAIEDAVKTTNDLFDQGLADMVINMTMNSRSGTLVRELEQDGRYELPKIWTTIEIMKRLGVEKCRDTRFFGFSVALNDPRTVGGCEGCNQALMPLIRKFSGDDREYEQLMEVADSTDCDCKQEWKDRLSQEPTTTLEERVAAGIDAISKKYLGKGFVDYK